MQFQHLVTSAHSTMYHWIFCEKIPQHKLAALKDVSSPPYVKSLFYDKSMKETCFLDKACEEWEPLLIEVIKQNVEPNRKSLEIGLARLNSSHDKKLFHPDSDHDNSIRFQSQGIKMMISRIADKKRNFGELSLLLGVARQTNSQEIISLINA